MTAPAAPNPATQDGEPLISVGAITAAVTAVIALLVAFGLHIGAERQAAILGVLAALAPLVTAAWGRTRVWSPKSVAALLANRPTLPPM